MMAWLDNRNDFNFSLRLKRIVADYATAANRMLGTQSTAKINNWVAHILRDLTTFYARPRLGDKDCGTMSHDLQCAGCDVKLYGRNVHEVCRYPSPGWRTEEIVQQAKDIAKRIRVDPCRDRLEQLADNLERSGCDNAEILRHLRGWVICHGCLGWGTVREPGGHGDTDTVGCPLCNKAARIGGPRSPDQGWLPSSVGHFDGCWAISDLLLFD